MLRSREKPSEAPANVPAPRVRSPSGSYSAVSPASRKASPFKTKGNLYHGTIAFFEHNHPGGFVALVSAATDPWIADFLRQSFLTGGMYEVMVVPELIELEARVMRLDLAKYLDKRARWQAERDMSGIHRMLLRLAAPDMIMARLPKVMTQTFNFGRPTFTQVGPGHFVGEIAGVPAALRYWLETCIAIYCETALAASGARSLMVRNLPSKNEPLQHGYPIATLRYEARWEP